MAAAASNTLTVLLLPNLSKPLQLLLGPQLDALILELPILSLVGIAQLLLTLIMTLIVLICCVDEPSLIRRLLRLSLLGLRSLSFKITLFCELREQIACLRSGGLVLACLLRGCGLGDVAGPQLQDLGFELPLCHLGSLRRIQGLVRVAGPQAAQSIV